MEFQRLDPEMQKDRLQNLSLDVKGRRERQRYSDERVFSFARWFEIFEFTKILWFRRMNEFICNCHYFLMNPLFNFEPVKDLSAEVMWKCLGVRVIARAMAF